MDYFAGFLFDPLVKNIEIVTFTQSPLKMKSTQYKLVNRKLKHNPAENTPHTADVVTGDWDRPYSQKLAAFPAKNLGAHKFWPSVGRIDEVYGDRNLICSCPAIENYED